MVDVLLGLLEGPVADVSGRESLVHLAIERAHVDILRALDKRGADFHVNDSMTSTLDVTDNEGKTPLIYACMHDYGEAGRILLERGADPIIVDCRGRGALYWAARRARLELFETICDRPIPEQCYPSHFAGALSAAVASRRSSFIDRLPYKYPGIWDLPDAEGWSPRYTATQYGTDIAHLHTDVEFEEKGFSYLPKRPARWSDTDRSPNLSVSSDGKVITVSGQWHLQEQASVHNYRCLHLSVLHNEVANFVLQGSQAASGRPMQRFAPTFRWCLSQSLIMSIISK
ncbi:putative ankyrin repeat protein [Metarhizium anisopliae]|nr:putative ankyrin repeat protein [Metarhizium anisopliae]